MKIAVILLFAFSSICFSQDFWQHTNGPYGSALVFTLVSDSFGNIYSGTSAQGICRTKDGDFNWQSIGLKGKGIVSILPYSDKIILAIADGLYKTWDAGVNWSKDTTVKNPTVIFKTENNSIIIASSGKIYRSVDEGRTWQIAATDISNMIVLSFAKAFSGKLFASTYTGIYVSSDDGVSWTFNADIGRPQWKGNLRNILFAKDDDHIFLFSTSNYNGYIVSNLYLSDDGGQNWTKMGNNIEGNNLGDISQFALSPSGDLLVSMGNNAGWKGSILSSTDNGNTWNALPNQMLHFNVNTMIINKDGLVLVGTSSGVYLSNESGISWESINNGFLASNIVKIYSSPSGSIFCSSDAVYRSKNEGDSWERLDFGQPDLNIRAFFSDMNGVLYAGGNGIFRSTNDGDSWQIVKSWGAINCFAQTPYGTLIAGDGNSSGIYRSTNNGLSWEESNSGLSDLTMFSMATTDLGTILAGSFGKIFRSTDNGLNWQTITPTDATVIALYRTKDNIIFAGTNSSFSIPSLLYSSDDGITWKSDTTFKHKNIIEIVENDMGDIFVASQYQGVLKSKDKGKSWSLLSNEGLGNLYIQTLSLSSNEYLYAGTWGNSLFRSVQVITGIPSETKTNPSQFLLEQNYPNPFNPSTTISYQIPNSGFISLKVYDILGKEVATLVDEEKPAGYYNVNFNGSSLSSGVYFYRLKAGNFVGTKKLILIK